MNDKAAVNFDSTLRGLEVAVHEFRAAAAGYKHLMMAMDSAEDGSKSYVSPPILKWESPSTQGVVQVEADLGTLSAAVIFDILSPLAEAKARDMLMHMQHAEAHVKTLLQVLQQAVSPEVTSNNPDNDGGL